MNYLHPDSAVTNQFCFPQSRKVRKETFVFFVSLWKIITVFRIGS